MSELSLEWHGPGRCTDGGKDAFTQTCHEVRKFAQQYFLGRLEGPSAPYICPGSSVGRARSFYIDV